MTWDSDDLHADVASLFEDLSVPPPGRYRNAALVREYGEAAWAPARSGPDPWWDDFAAWAATAAVNARQQLAQAAAERAERWPHRERADHHERVGRRQSVEAVLEARSLRAVRRVRGFTPGVRPAYAIEALPARPLEPCACGARRELRLGSTLPVHIGRSTAKCLRVARHREKPTTRAEMADSDLVIDTRRPTPTCR